MFEEVKVLTHSSIKITGKKTIYFDPFEVQEESHDADLIFVTHDHHDHYSPEDIKKVAGDKEQDPWEWREIIAGTGEVAYGKFFGRKSGFISKEWLPVFANFRKDGYDFDAR